MFKLILSEYRCTSSIPKRSALCSPVEPKDVTNEDRRFIGVHCVGSVFDRLWVYSLARLYLGRQGTTHDICVVDVAPSVLRRQKNRSYSQHGRNGVFAVTRFSREVLLARTGGISCRLTKGSFPRAIPMRIRASVKRSAWSLAFQQL